MVHYIGIDPGKTGGMSVIKDGKLTIHAFKNLSEHDIAKLFKKYWFDQTKVVIEKVHSMPKQGVKSTFTFGQGYGFLRGCLHSGGFPFQEVRPQVWMKYIGIPVVKNEGKTDRKRRLKATAQQLYPSHNINQDVADSVLIAEYCRRFG